MVVFVLDASAILRFIDDEAGSDRLEEIFQMRKYGPTTVLASANHWGEVVGILSKRYSGERLMRAMTELQELPIEVVPVTKDRAEKAANIRIMYRIPYVDSFAIELLEDGASRILVTADYDMHPARQDYKIE